VAGSACVADRQPGPPWADPGTIAKDGLTYVPLRAVAESLACTVDYDPRAGVFVWGGSQSPQLPGLPSDWYTVPHGPCPTCGQQYSGPGPRQEGETEAY